MTSATIPSGAPTGASSVPRIESAHPLWLIYAAASVYALLVALTVHRHEPWADEAQSWLLARDASLTDLWGRLLHYEGTPGLWQTLVHALIRLGLSYRPTVTCQRFSVSWQFGFCFDTRRCLY